MSKFKLGDKVVENCHGLEKLQTLSNKEVANVLEVGENGQIRLDGTDCETNSDWFDENDWILSRSED